jgi:hypothetical protein
MIEKRPPPVRAGTSDELRKDIDTGQTGDKVPFRDPAAAPLGADDEAAGKPPTPEEVSMAREQEGVPGVVTHPHVGEEGRADFVARQGNPSLWIAIALAVLVLAAIAIAALFTW